MLNIPQGQQPQKPPNNEVFLASASIVCRLKHLLKQMIKKQPFKLVKRTNPLKEKPKFFRVNLHTGLSEETDY